MRKAIELTLAHQSTGTLLSTAIGSLYSLFHSLNVTKILASKFRLETMLIVWGFPMLVHNFPFISLNLSFQSYFCAIIWSRVWDMTFIDYF